MYIYMCMHTEVSDARGKMQELKIEYETRMAKEREETKVKYEVRIHTYIRAYIHTYVQTNIQTCISKHTNTHSFVFR